MKIGYWNVEFWSTGSDPSLHHSITPSTPEEPVRLAGKVAIVTGGARHIGAAYCRKLAEEGAAVVVADILDGERSQPTKFAPRAAKRLR